MSHKANMNDIADSIEHLASERRTPRIGEVKMRYPNNDPGDGPAYLQKWDGKEWCCANHKFKLQEFDDIDDDGRPNGKTYTQMQCVYCGEEPETE